MSYPVRCPYCGTLLKAESEWALKQSTCPNCHHALTIPPPPVPEVLAGTGPVCSPQYSPQAGADYCNQAVIAFLVTVICCGLLGLVLAIDAGHKMKASGNMHGHGWVIATYIVFALQLVAGILARFVRN